MYIIGIGYMLQAMIAPWVTFYYTYKLECGLNHKYQYYSTNSYGLANARIWGQISITCFISWDVMTLLLYAIKVIQFRCKHDEQTSSKDAIQRIMSILNRILVLTILYQFMNCHLLYSFQNHLFHIQMMISG